MHSVPTSWSRPVPSLALCATWARNWQLPNDPGPSALPLAAAQPIFLPVRDSVSELPSRRQRPGQTFEASTLPVPPPPFGFSHQSLQTSGDPLPPLLKRAKKEAVPSLTAGRFVGVAHPWSGGLSAGSVPCRGSPASCRRTGVTGRYSDADGPWPRGTRTHPCGSRTEMAEVQRDLPSCACPSLLPCLPTATPGSAPP